MEGYDFDVVGEDMQDYKCPICLMLLRDAFVMPCSHSACKLCLRKWAKQGNSGVYRCPSCQTAYDREKVGKRNEHLIDRVITTSLKVKCKQHFKTCDWIGTISDYECHEKTCLYTSVLCGYASCDVTVCRKDLKEHQDQCSYRTIQCEFCSQQFPHEQLEDHHMSCDYFEVTCLQLCHGELMARKDVQAHIEYHCPNTEMKCPLHEIGCMEIMRRKDIENHINNSILQHTPLLLAFTFDLETEIKQLKDSASSQIIEIEELKKNQLEQCAGIKELKQFKTGFQIEFEEMKASTSLMISELEEKLKEKAVNVTSSSHQKVEWKSLHGNANAVVKMKDTANRNYIPNKDEVKIKDTASKVDVRIKDATAYKDGVRGNYTTKKIMQTVKFHEDICTFNDKGWILKWKKRLTNRRGESSTSTVIHEVTHNGRYWSFYDVYKLLRNEKYTTFRKLFKYNRNILNNLRSMYNETFLMDASISNVPHVVEHLTKEFKNDIDVWAVDKRGWNAYHLAAMQGSGDVMKMLLSFDRSRLNHGDNAGKTPLHWAAWRNNKHIVELLLNAGADVDAVDNKGRTLDRSTYDVTTAHPSYSTSST